MPFVAAIPACRCELRQLENDNDEAQDPQNVDGLFAILLAAKEQEKKIQLGRLLCQ